MNKNPWFKFFPGDWLKDPELRRCSPAARGVWMDLLCLMYESEECGVLASDGQSWTDEDIVAAIAGDTTAVLSALHELVRKRVAKRDARGAIYCSRLLRDHKKQLLCSEAGKRGGGNPTFKGRPKGRPKVSAKVPPNVPPNVPSDVCSLTSDFRGGGCKGAGESAPPLRPDCAPTPAESPDESNGFAGLCSDAVIAQLVSWLGNGHVGSWQLEQAGRLVRDYGERIVTDGIRICLEQSKKSWPYLQAVCRNGSEKRVATGKTIDQMSEADWQQVFSGGK